MSRENDDNRTVGLSEREMSEGNFITSFFSRDKGVVRLGIKIGLILLIFFVIFYLLYFATRYGQARFILSNHEILTAEEEASGSHLVFNPSDKVFFYIGREGKNVESDLVVVEIEVSEGGGYKHYKQISYEVEKIFPKLSGYIPGEYFSRSGKYRIKALLDGKIVSTKDITIN